MGHLVLETPSQTFSVLQSADPIRQREEEHTHTCSRHTHTELGFILLRKSQRFSSLPVGFWQILCVLAEAATVGCGAFRCKKTGGQHRSGTKLAFYGFGQQGPPELASNRLKMYRLPLLGSAHTTKYGNPLNVKTTSGLENQQVATP